MIEQLKIVNVIIAQHQIHYYFYTVFAHVLFVHQPGANHAPRASVTQVTHSVHTLNTFLSIRADRSISADLLGHDVTVIRSKKKSYLRHAELKANPFRADTFTVHETNTILQHHISLLSLS